MRPHVASLQKKRVRSGVFRLNPGLLNDAIKECTHDCADILLIYSADLISSRQKWRPRRLLLLPSRNARSPRGYRTSPRDFCTRRCGFISRVMSPEVDVPAASLAQHHPFSSVLSPRKRTITTSAIARRTFSRIWNIKTLEHKIKRFVLFAPMDGHADHEDICSALGIKTLPRIMRCANTGGEQLKEKINAFKINGSEQNTRKLGFIEMNEKKKKGIESRGNTSHAWRSRTRVEELERCAQFENGTTPEYFQFYYDPSFFVHSRKNGLVLSPTVEHMLIYSFSISLGSTAYDVAGWLCRCEDLARSTRGNTDGEQCHD